LGAFVFALSGGAAAVKGRLDLFGVLVLSFTAANAAGLTRDLLIGAVPPAAISDWRYLAIFLLAGLVIFFQQLNDLLGKDPAEARREIQKHIGDLRIAPTPEMDERVVQVTGRARIDGLLDAEEAVRLQLVAGVGFEPATFAYEPNLRPHKVRLRPDSTCLQNRNVIETGYYRWRRGL
jgi:hypothetical protein